MPSAEQVTYLIDAEDKATAKIRKVTASVQNQEKMVQRLGSQSKASAELAGSLFSAFGNSEIGQYTSQFAELNDRVRAYSDAAKAGGKASVALRGGLVAAAGAAGLFIGSKIGREISGLNHRIRHVERSIESLRDTASETGGQLIQFFENESAYIASLRDREERERMLASQAQRVNNEVAGKRILITSLEKQVADMERWWSFTRSDNYQKLIDLNKANLAIAKETSTVYKAQKQALTDQNSEYARRIENEKRIAALTNSNESKIRSIREELARVGMTANELELDRNLKGISGNKAANEVLELTKAIQKKRSAINAEKQSKLRVEALAKQAEELKEQRHKRELARIEDERKARVRILEGQLSGQRDALSNLDSNKQSTLTGPLQAGASQRLITGRAGASFRKTAAVVEAERQTKQDAKRNKILTQIDVTLKRLEQAKQPQIKVLGS